jgi:hypothetical protein
MWSPVAGVVLVPANKVIVNNKIGCNYETFVSYWWSRVFLRVKALKADFNMADRVFTLP